MKNVMTIDVEDYFHVASLSNELKPDSWDKIAPRVQNNTQRILDIFDQYNVKATFFVLGLVANKFPDLVKEIDRRGHEVASHGYSHQLIYNQSYKEFKDETKKSKSILEQIIGKSVVGYRAASYSITEKSLWALDILADLEFKYDSSIYPVTHDVYGISGSPTEPHFLTTPNGSALFEFPPSTYKILNYQLPVAGGGYFRLYPYWLTRYFFKSINKRSNVFAFYLHPWEIDPDQPRVNTNALSKFRHYNNLEKCEARLINLLQDFEFTSMDHKIKEIDCLSGINKAVVSYQNFKALS